MNEKQPSNTIPDSYQEHPIENARPIWTVRRSNGDIESGWIETGRGIHNGIDYARVFKSTQDGEFLTKNVPLAELQELQEQKHKEAREAKFADLALESSGVEGPRDAIEQQVEALSETDKIALWQYANAIHDNEINNSLSKMSSEARAIAADYRESWQRRKTGE